MTTRRHDIAEYSKVMLEGIEHMTFRVEKHHGVFLVLRDMFGEKIRWEDWQKVEGWWKYDYSYGEVKCHERYVI